jgi:hypothetical protein
LNIIQLVYMVVIKDIFVQKCLDVLKRSEVKDEIKLFLKPLIDMILQEIYPYIYLSMLFVIISFLLILGIFILLLRNKQLF